MPLFEYNYRSEVAGAVLLPQDTLADHGPWIEVSVGVPDPLEMAFRENGMEVPEPVHGRALIDTGTHRTAIDEGVCRRLNLSPTGLVDIGHANGKSERACYPVLMKFLGSEMPPITFPRVLSVDLSGSGSKFIGLLGRDFLKGFRMVYNGPKGRVELMR